MPFYPYDCRILPSVTVVSIRFRVNKSLVIFRKSSRNATYGLHCKYFITIMQNIICWVMVLGIWPVPLLMHAGITPRLPRGSGWDVLLAVARLIKSENLRIGIGQNWYELRPSHDFPFLHYSLFILPFLPGTLFASDLIGRVSGLGMEPSANLLK